jgi:mannose-6-phosphate isomerase-like protein (cupin superfamily)
METLELVQSGATSEETHQKIDALECYLLERFPSIEIPIIHVFTPGMYCRHAFLQAGGVFTSKIHNTEHPYVILEGEVVVFQEGEGTKTLKAGFFGITKAGTRRVLRAVTMTHWVTFHATDKDNPEEIVEQITDRRLPALSDIPQEKLSQ